MHPSYGGPEPASNPTNQKGQPRWSARRGAGGSDWHRHGLRTGVPRNLMMLDLHPDQLLAFQIGWSPGTQHTINPVRQRNTPVGLHRCN